MRAAIGVALVCIVAAAAAAGEDLIKNGSFAGTQQADGSLEAWRRQTQTTGFVKLMDEGKDRFVRIGNDKPQQDSFLQQVIAVPDGCTAVDLSATLRWQDIKTGVASWHQGRVQIELLDESGKRIGNIQSMGPFAGTQSDWKEFRKRLSLPAEAKQVKLKLAVFQVEGHIDFKEVSARAVTEADILKERAQFRPQQEFGEAVSDKRFAALARGVNINNWFCQPYNATLSGTKGTFSAEFFKDFVSDEELRSLRRAGFTHIRLPVEPTPLMNKDGSVKELAAELDKAIERVLAADLAVVVDAHPKIRGSDLDKLGENADIRKAFVAWWGQMAKRLSRFDPDKVFLEALNEPGGQGLWVNNYPPYQDELLTAIRAGAPKHTIIANGGAYQLCGEIVKHKPHPDRNVIYAVHYYNPSQFTHQGAKWMKPWYHGLRNVPWPLTEQNLDQAISSVADVKTAEESRAALRGAVKGGVGTRQRISDDFASMAKWAQDNQRRIVIGEFGVYKPYAAEADRLAWLQCVSSEASRHNMGWSMWEWCAEFGLTQGAPGSRTMDPKALTSLGLSSATSAPASAPAASP
jgi:aryl-phospho-beta-D-glucosidase BglC (GH1 family)